MAWEVAAELSPAAVRALVAAATGPEGRVVRQLPAASERLVCRTLNANRNALRYRPRLNATAREIRAAVVKLSNCYPTQGHRKILSHVRTLGLHVGLRQVRRIRRGACKGVRPLVDRGVSLAACFGRFDLHGEH